jgi:hypothetical protein
MGSFTTVKVLTQHFHQLLISAEDNYLRGFAPAPTCQPLDESIFTPLVLTHNYLNMHHILVDNNGLLWIIGWNWAGFYPTWFEYLVKTSNSWINFVVEPAFRIKRWMERVVCGF